MTFYEQLADETMKLAAIAAPGSLVKFSDGGRPVPATWDTATDVIVEAWFGAASDDGRLMVHTKTLPIAAGTSERDVAAIRYSARLCAAAARMDAHSAAASED